MNGSSNELIVFVPFFFFILCFLLCPSVTEPYTVNMKYALHCLPFIRQHCISLSSPSFYLPSRQHISLKAKSKKYTYK